MQILEHTESRLVLRERPWLVWLVGGLLAASGAYVALFGGEPLFGAAFVVVGLGAVLLAARTVTCTFDETLNLLTHETVGPLRRRSIEHPLADVRAVRVVQGASHARTYRVELDLPGGKSLPLTPSYSSGKAGQEATARLIRAFLRLPDPGELEPFTLRDLVGILRPPPSPPRD